MGGTPDDGGTDSGGNEDPGYVACTAATAAADCGTGAQCRESDEIPILAPKVFVCEPPCTAPADCPAAPAGGGATVECNDGFCQLSCSTGVVECPTGMVCAAKDGVETCYDDGV